MKPGQIVGGYELVSLIAQGGMGVIWKARHPSLERWVAIKHIRGEVGGDDSIRRAFVQEVKNWKLNNHLTTVAANCEFLVCKNRPLWYRN